MFIIISMPKYALKVQTGWYEDSYMQLQPPNQSFLQFTFYLVNLNSHFFRRPPQQLILTQKFH